MKKSIFVILAATLASLATAFARPVRLDVQLRPPVLSRSEISEIVRPSSEGLIDDSKLGMTALSLLAALRQRGYPLASVDSLLLSEEGENSEASLFIDCGPELTAVHEDNSRTPISTALLEETASDLLDSLTDAGFPFATIAFAPKRPVRADNGLKISLITDLSPGSFLRIGRVNFPGGQDAGGKHLLLTSRLKIGETFRGTDLWHGIERIERLPQVAAVGEPVLKDLSPGFLEISIPVVTRSSTRISGIAAVSPGSAQPTGQFTIDIGNLFGGGRSASFAWFGLNPDQRGLKGSYREGWIYDLPIAVKGELEGWQTRESHNRTLYRFGAEWELYSDIELGISGAAERIAALSSSTQSLNSSTRWLGSTIVVSRLDDGWNPSGGYRLSLASEKGWREFAANSPTTSLQSGRTKLEIARQLPFGANPLTGARFFGKRHSRFGKSKWIGYLRIENRFAAGRNLLSDELPHFGGHLSVRGFSEDYFTGRNVLFGATEIRFRPDRQSGYVGLTFDWGWIAKLDQAREANNRTASSIGLSTSFRSELGIMSLDLAWPTGEPAERSRLHIALSGWL